MLMPALLTRISTRPNSACVRAIIRSTAALSVTSATMERALPPPCMTSATPAFDWATPRPTTATAAPAAASPRAMPSPMPPLPPVTIATRPVSSKGEAVIDGPFSPSSGHHEFWLPPAAPDQDQPDQRERRAIPGPLNLADHETGLRPRNQAGALTNPEQAYEQREDTDCQQCRSHDVNLTRPAIPHWQIPPCRR